MANKSIEKKTKTILGIMILLLMALFIAFNLGSSNILRVLFAVTGILIGTLLLTESRVIDYFQEKRFRSVSTGDFMVFLLTIVGVLVLFNSALFLIPQIEDFIGTTLVNTLRSTAIISAIAGAIIGVIAIWTPRFK